MTRRTGLGAPWPEAPTWLLHSALGLHLLLCLSFPVCTVGTMAAPDSGTPHLARLGVSSNTCYFYQANIHPGPETLPEEVEVRAPHEPECNVACKVMPLGELQTWPCRIFERQSFKHLCLCRSGKPPGAAKSPDWLSQVPTFLPFTFSINLVLFSP